MTSLRSLPGVGRYTAAAVASIAFDHPEPIVEANSRRVIARLIGHAKPLAGTDADGPIWRAAESLVPSRHAGRYNQALMDLGAMVCTPVSPRCGVCPLARWCEAKRTGQANLIPVMAPRPRVVERREVALVVLRRRRLLLERRHEHEWWSGLWDFPRLSGARPRLVKQARDDHRHLGRFTYSVTRHHVRAEVLRIDGDDHLLVESGDPRRERRWVPIDHLDGIAMPAPARRIALRLVGTLPRKGRSTR